MLGGGVWVFAALKGYSGFDDPYPDHGKMDRAARDASEAMGEFREEARAELEAPINEARAALLARMEKIRAECEAMHKNFDQAAMAFDALSAQTRGLDSAAQSAIQTYRDENASARTGAAPAYFDAPPPLPAAPADALAPAARLIGDARACLQEAQDQSAQAFAALLDELEGAQKRLDAAHPA